MNPWDDRAIEQRAMWFYTQMGGRPENWPLESHELRAEYEALAARLLELGRRHGQ